MNNFKNPAIILGGDSVNALGVARNLGRNNVKVFCVNEKKNEVAFSRYCQEFFVIPGIERSNEILKSFLFRMEKRMKDGAVLFPSSDLFCINLSHVTDKGASKHIFLADKNAIETLVDKRRFYKSLEENNVPHPDTYFPEKYEDINEIERHIDYPVLVKPAITQLFSRFKRKGLVARSERDLENYYRLILKYDIGIVIQDIIPGPPTNLFGVAGYFDRHYNPTGLFAYRRIREWPNGFGCNSLIESIPVNSVSILKEITSEYLRNLKYSGLFEAEFKKDLRDGSFKLLEINARSWWQNHFPTICGINLVIMAYLDAIGKKIEYRETYKTGVKWVFFLNDLLSSIEMFQKNRINSLEWLVSYKNVKDYAYFNAKDPLPWLVNPLMTGPEYFRALLRKAKKIFKSNKIPENSFRGCLK